MDYNQSLFLFLVTFGNFLFFPLYLPILVLIFLFGLCCLLFVLLILDFQPVPCGLVNFTPHLTDDFGQVSNFGIWVFSLNIIIDFSTIKEESRQRLFRRSWLHKCIVTFPSLLSFLPILYRILNTKGFLLSNECIIPF